jgi:signal peptidase I
MRRNYIIPAVAAVVVVVVILGYFGSIPYLSPIIHGEKFLQVGGSSMQPTIKSGATVTYEEVPFSELKVDDIIVFNRPSDNMLIIARITLLLPDGLQTKGDNNPAPYDWTVTSAMYVGKVVRIDNPP